jgi:hypothetical protein
MIYTCLWIRQALSQQEDRQLCRDRLCQKIKFQNKTKFHSYLPTPPLFFFFFFFFFCHVIGNQHFFLPIPKLVHSYKRLPSVEQTLLYSVAHESKSHNCDCNGSVAHESKSHNCDCNGSVAHESKSHRFNGFMS